MADQDQSKKMTPLESMRMAIALRQGAPDPYPLVQSPATPYGAGVNPAHAWLQPASPYDFGDPATYAQGGKIDPYSASMLYGSPWNGGHPGLIGINDPRPTTGAAAQDLMDKMTSGW